MRRGMRRGMREVGVLMEVVGVLMEVAGRRVLMEEALRSNDVGSLALLITQATTSSTNHLHTLGLRAQKLLSKLNKASSTLRLTDHPPEEVSRPHEDVRRAMSHGLWSGAIPAD